MLKRIFATILAALLAVGLLACGKGKGGVPDMDNHGQMPTVPPTEDNTETITTPIIVNGKEAILCPWETDVTEQAKKDGRIHYYFMASHGLFMSAEESNPYKWGDGCLMVFPDGRTMLIDGGMEAYAPVIVANLKRMGIKKLDYVMMSHSHNDHCYGLLCEGGVLESFPVGKIFWNGITCQYWKDMDLIKRCNELGIPMEALKKGDVRTFGNVTMEVLWPRNGHIGTGLNNTKEINNLSLTVCFSYKGHSSLFTGDLYVDGEEKLVNSCGEKLDVDLLKLPHHGSNTSSSAKLLCAVTPKLSVGTGYVEILGTVMSRLVSVGSKVVYDWANGYIHVSSDGTRLEYDTEQTRSEGKTKIILLP